MSKVFGLFAFLLYLVVGIYLINWTFNFISIPNFIKSIDPGIMVIAGVMVIAGGINYLRAGNKTPMQQQMHQ